MAFPGCITEADITFVKTVHFTLLWPCFLLVTTNGSFLGNLQVRILLGVPEAVLVNLTYR